jgi:hypothetical protein
MFSPPLGSHVLLTQPHTFSRPLLCVVVTRRGACGVLRPLPHPGWARTQEAAASVRRAAHGRQGLWCVVACRHSHSGGMGTCLYGNGSTCTRTHGYAGVESNACTRVALCLCAPRFHTKTLSRHSSPPFPPPRSPPPRSPMHTSAHHSPCFGWVLQSIRLPGSSGSEPVRGPWSCI